MRFDLITRLNGTEVEVTSGTDTIVTILMILIIPKAN